MSADSFVLLGQGFDTIVLSLRATVPQSLSESIVDARAAARDTLNPEPVALGPGAVVGEVLRHGGGGGGGAMFSTGDLGEMWFFKLDQRRDPWGVTIKIHSLALLCYGFKGALERLWQRARALGLTADGYSLGRVDYRSDILTDRAFAPVFERFVTPNRMLLKPYEIFKRGHPLYDWSDDPDARRYLRGTRIETIMAGKIGESNQVVLYDKRAEQVAKKKTALAESYGLDFADPSVGLWRAEARFSGDVLKRRWHVRHLEDLSQRLHPMLHKALTRVRYVDEQVQIPLPQRPLDPLWQRVTDAIAFATCDQPSQFAPERAEYLLRQDRERSFKDGIAGSGIALAASGGKSPDEIRRDTPEMVRHVAEAALTSHPEKADWAAKREVARFPDTGRNTGASNSGRETGSESGRSRVLKRC